MYIAPVLGEAGIVFNGICVFVCLRVCLCVCVRAKKLENYLKSEIDAGYLGLNRSMCHGERDRWTLDVILNTGDTWPWPLTLRARNNYSAQFRALSGQFDYMHVLCGLRAPVKRTDVVTTVYSTKPGSAPSATDHFVWLSHVHGTDFLPASQH